MIQHNPMTGGAGCKPHDLNKSPAFNAVVGWWGGTVALGDSEVPMGSRVLSQETGGPAYNIDIRQ